MEELLHKRLTIQGMTEIHVHSLTPAIHTNVAVQTEKWTAAAN